MDWRVDHKRIRRPLNLRDWGLAQQRARQIESEGLGASVAPLAIEKAAEKFMQDCVARGLAPATLRRYRSHFTKLHLFCQDHGYIFLPQLTTDVLRSFRQGWKLSARTAQKHLEVLKTFFRFCVDSNFLASNPAKTLKPPKTPASTITPFNELEITKVFANCEGLGALRQPGRLLLLGRLLLSTGLRIGDACTLTRDKIVKDTAGYSIYLRTAKSGMVVYCPLPDDLAESILALPGTNPFWTGVSTAETVAGFYRRQFAAVFKRAGVTGHLHRFRHSFATRLLLAGTDIESVASLLGHSNTQITQRHYSAWTLARQAKLADAVRKSWHSEGAPETQ
jgi:site-specific recombinase XerD